MSTLHLHGWNGTDMQSCSCCITLWTPHGHIIDHIDIEPEVLEEIKEKLTTYYNNYYLKTIFCSTKYQNNLFGIHFRIIKDK